MSVDSARDGNESVVHTRRRGLPLSEYVGVYADSLHGELVIGEKDGKLSLTFGPTWRGTLDHWHLDTFRTRFETPVFGAIPVTFRLNAAAKVDEVQIDMAGPITFKRRPETERR
jgi:hypothetical protein